jgi:hypothetical protein
MATAKRFRFKPADDRLYGRILEHAVQGKKEERQVPLSREDLTRVIQKSRDEGEAEGWFHLKEGSSTNESDVLHEFAGRRDRMPEKLRKKGYSETRKIAGSWYLIKAKHPPQIALPNPSAMRVTKIRDLVPDVIRDLVPGDEQGLLARAGESNVLAMFLGVQATIRIAAHWKGAGVEIDEVHCAIASGRVVLIPVEAKGQKESLVRHQVASGVERMRSLVDRKTNKPLSLSVRPVGLKATGENEIVLVEFNATDDPDRLKIKRAKRYRFVTPA